LTGSTNADLLALAREGASDGTWLYADQQTAGRGRQGRSWVSPLGNLYASGLVRLHPDDPPTSTLALVAGIAAIDVLQSYLPTENLRLKWPNDVLVGQAKLAGILLEREGDAVVIGIGANLATHPTDLARPATSIAALGGHIVPVRDVIVALAERLSYWRNIWLREGVAPIAAAWAARAHPLGTPLAVDTGDPQRLAGVFDGLDRTGALRLRLADGSISVIHAGDVFLV